MNDRSVAFEADRQKCGDPLFDWYLRRNGIAVENLNEKTRTLLKVTGISCCAAMVSHCQLNGDVDLFPVRIGW